MSVQLSKVVVWTVLILLAPTEGLAQEGVRWFGGGLAGVSTLSADARHILSASGLAVSLFKPENGLATNVFVELHLADYVTVQANHMWNRNALTLTSTRSERREIAF